MPASSEKRELLDEIEALRTRLEEAEETIRAIRSGEIDALVTSGPNGDQVFTLQHAERPYRVLIETMQEGAVTVSEQGFILYCNQRFADMLKMPLEKVLGALLQTFIAPEYRDAFQTSFFQCHFQNIHTEAALWAGDGTLVPVSVALSPLALDENTTAVCLVASDQTVQQRREHELILLQKIQFDISEASNLDAALQIVLQNIIETTRWTYGEAWILSADGSKLECICEHYHSRVLPEPDALRVKGLVLDLDAGLIGQARATQKTLILSNPTADELFPGIALTQHTGFTAGIVVPIVAEEEVVSILVFFTCQTTQLDEHFIRLTSTVAAQLRSFIRRKRSENALRQAHQELEMHVRERTDELQTANILLRQEIVERRRAEEAEHKQRNLAEALRDIAIALSSSLDLPEVLQRILTNVSRVVAHATADIMLIDGKTIYVAGCRGYAEHNLEEAVMDFSVSLDDAAILRRIAETGQPVILPEILNYPGWFKLGEYEWRHSYAGLPIRSAHQFIGFLNITSTIPAFFTQERVDALQIFADEAALAIQNARLHQQAQTLAAMKERERLARELHDAVSQTLFSASIVAEALPRLRERHPDEMQNGLDELHRLARGALSEMRSLLLELRPKALEEAELKTLLPQLVEAIRSRKDVDISIQCDDITFTPEVKLSFYRIAQEALNNITKHSHASQASIVLEKHDDQVEMLISDNGRGFDPAKVPSTSLGLNIMRERAVAIGARLTISSEAHQGTQVRVVWVEGETQP